MPIFCKVCAAAEDKQSNAGLHCELCMKFVHLKCLRTLPTPGNFAKDVFFEFKCSDCSPLGIEELTRNKNTFPWLLVIYLAIHHMNIHSRGMSNMGFFHYKTHIASFIDRNWNILFEKTFKQKKSWIGTIAGQLSANSSTYFRSGLQELGEPGWWKLRHEFSPAIALHIAQELARDKPKGRNKKGVTSEMQIFLAKTAELGYEQLLTPPGEENMAEASGVIPQPHSMDAVNDWVSDVQMEIKMEVDEADDQSFIVEQEEIHPLTSEVENPMPDPVDLENQGYLVLDFESSLVNTNAVSSDASSLQSTRRPDEPDSRSVSPHTTFSQPQPEATTTLEPKQLPTKTKKIRKPPKKHSLFSTLPNSTVIPFLPEKSTMEKDLVELSEYEEIQLLKQVESMVDRVVDPCKKAQLCRFKAKLALRRLKRHRHLPVFDLDKTVKKLYGQETTISVNPERVLDRFQRSTLLDDLSGTITSNTVGTICVSHVEPSCIQSPLSGATLKPYIRRDTHAEPLWLRVQEELLKKANRNNPEFILPPRATLDFSYVKPHHIAAVNALCAQMLWPGIDLTEALQYPEHSCVVTYRQLVVGCGFLVPDTAPHEAYISFLVTRSHWDGAGIGTFMLYHLLQTCTGKDVTLHVSPTNPAIFLYQKFGFKVEELVQDFYEKYYDLDHKGCRHALFCRLVR